MTYIGINPSEIYRGIDKAGKNSSTKDSTPLADSAFAKAEKKDNKAGITIALEDFSKMTSSFNEDGRSQVKYSDAKNSLWDNVKSFFGNKSDNVFKDSEVKAALKENSYTQNDVYAEDIAKNSGLKYAKDGDDIYKSALNFTKADIAAIEKSFNNAHVEDGISSKNGKLDSGEISSYLSDNTFLSDSMEGLDLDGKAKTVSAEEYASYVVLADSNNDGKITSEEANAFKNAKASDLQTKAQSIFDKHYKK